MTNDANASERTDPSTSFLADAISKTLGTDTGDDLSQAIGSDAICWYDEKVCEAEREAADRILFWWREHDNANEIVGELIERIRDEAPDAVGPGQLASDPDNIEVLGQILRDEGGNGARAAYVKIVNELVEDARMGRKRPVRAWTVQVGNAGFQANTVVVEARTIEEACSLAIRKAEDDTDGWVSVDDVSQSFIDAIGLGRSADPWSGEGWRDVPEGFTQDCVLGDRSTDGERRPGPSNRPDRIWTSDGITIDLGLVRMLNRRKDVQGKIEAVVVWHDRSDVTVLRLGEEERASLHAAFAATARGR